jgi:hypothetical protein
MSWAKLLADNRVTSLPPNKAELDNLRSIVARSLKDAAAAGLSADARFMMAYAAAQTLSLLVPGFGLPTALGGRTLQHVSGARGSRFGICKIVSVF